MSNHIAAKSLTIKVCAAVLSLLLLTLVSCVSYEKTTSYKQTVAAFGPTWEAMSPEEQATSLAEPKATNDARATSEAEATEAAATAAAQATATAAAQRPVPSGVCTTAGALCIVVGKFQLDPYYPEDSILENRLSMVFPVDGGAVSGDYLWSTRVGESGPEPCVHRYDYPGTLDGNYDPASGRLGGAVLVGKGTWTVLEGCENVVIEDIGTATSWWATYDAVTGHVVGTTVFVDADGEESELPFEGDARSELDTD